ncbi:hypothetical protein JW859_03200 [bacterium]|nr:hypothetical protein [bacterium]
MLTNRSRNWPVAAAWLLLPALLLFTGCRTSATPDPDPSAGSITLAATYNRATHNLAVDATHSLGEEITISLNAPAWIEPVDGPTWAVPASGTLVIELAFAAAANDAANVTVQAIGADGATASQTVAIQRGLAVSIDNVTYNEPRLLAAVTVSAAEDSEVELTLAVDEALATAAPQQHTLTGGGDHTFDLELTPRFALAIGVGKSFGGGSGNVTLTATATDQFGDAVTATRAQAVSFTAVEIPAGCLVAVPLERQVELGDAVTIVVASGDFPAAAPFHYANGLGITAEETVCYSDNSWNIGIPGGAFEEFDGLWSTMDPVPASVLLPGDMMIQFNNIGNGRARVDFNVTPIGGSNTTAGGALMSFQLRPETAGPYTLGFQQFNEVKRTYYADSEYHEYYWDDISNVVDGIPNSFVVVE